MANVLYIHGMGGGSDSRIPSILNEYFSACDSSSGKQGKPTSVSVIARTYDFDPDKAHEQILSWVEELRPVLIIGESLGAIHALRVRGFPHLLISPALNAPRFLHVLSYLAFIPGVTPLFDRIYRPKEGDRQSLHFSHAILSKYPLHLEDALANSIRAGSDDFFFSFFGTRDHYRRTGVVSIRTWKKYFGDTFRIYEGTHFTEEEHIHRLVIPAIEKVLNMKK